MKKLLYGTITCLIILLLLVAVRSRISTNVIATIAVGEHPAGLAITPDDKFVYVANSGSDTVSVISTEKNAVVATITGFTEPYTVTMNRPGTLAYISNSGIGPARNSITVINTKTNTVEGSISGFYGPDGMVIMPDGNTAYVANYGFPDTPSIATGGTTVSVVDLNKNKIIQEISVGSCVATVALRPDGKYVYAANYNDGRHGHSTLSVIDTATNTVVKTIPGFFGAYRIAIAPDCQSAYVTNFGNIDFVDRGSTISVVDLNTHTITQTITLGNQPSSVALTPDGKLLCATIYNHPNDGAGQGSMKIIKCGEYSVVGTPINLGPGPSGIVINNAGTYAYVTNYVAGTVNVIQLPKF